MFGFLKGSSGGIKVIDKVWMYKSAKLNACAGMYRVNPQILFIAWFEETFNELKLALNLSEESMNLLLARDLDPAKAKGRMIVFAEHYPLWVTEQAMFSKLNMQEVPVLSSLDEPLFLKFGGEKTIDLMKKIGMKEDEVIGHSMITRSIRNAQEKIAKYAPHTDAGFVSQKDWFSANMK